MARDPARALYDSVLDLHRRRLWQRVEPDAYFLLRVEGEPRPLAVCVMGHNGEEYGVLLLRGERGLAQILALHDPSVRPEDSHDWDMLSATVERWSDLPPEHQRSLQRAGFRARREQLAPLVIHKAPGAAGGPAGKSAGRVLLAALRAIVVADERGLLRPRSLTGGGERVLELTATGPPLAPEVAARFVPLPEGCVLPEVENEEGFDEDETVELSIESVVGRPELVDEVWHVALEPVPRRAPLHTFAVTIPAREFVLNLRALDVSDLEGLFDGLLGAICRDREAEEAFDAEPLLPRRMDYEHPALEEVFGDELRALGVELVRARPPAFARKFLRMVAEIVEPDGVEPGTPPAPDDLAEWKQAELDAIARHVSAAMQQLDPRATDRYFGSEEAARRVLSDESALRVAGALVDWYFFDYRTRRNARTHCERLLAKRDLPAVDRAVLEAKRDAPISLYRVDATEPGATLDVTDLLTGERLTLHDRALSGEDVEGLVLPLRAPRLGKFRFPTLAGPPLRPHEAVELLDELAAAGADTDPVALRANAHLFGRLWARELDRAAHPPRIQNTDGDPLEPLVATFHVADPSALASALADRDDLDQDPSDGSFTWFREEPSPNSLGRRTLLGRLRPFGDELLAEVNSPERLARLRAWLDAVPGVEFAHSRAPQPAPLDDQLPGARADDPDLTAALAEVLSSHYLSLLDEPLPLFDGRTPREHAATPEGRRAVTRWIRTLPDSATPSGRVPPPRRALFEALGLPPDAADGAP